MTSWHDLNLNWFNINRFKTIEVFPSIISRLILIHLFWLIVCDWLVILRHIRLGDDHDGLVFGDVGGGGGVPGGEGGRDVVPGAGRGHRCHRGGPQLRSGPLEGGGTGARPLGTLGLILASWPGGGHLDTRRGQRLETSTEALVTPEHEQLEAVHLDWRLGEVDDGVSVNAIEAAGRVFVFPDSLDRRLLDLDTT